MIRKARFLLLILVCLYAQAQVALAASGNDNKYNHVTFQSLPALTASPGQGISAPFAGTLNDGALIVAGGCNFPDTPAAEGGTKVCYDRVWLLPADGKAQAWQEIGRLPRALAYGASVTVGDGVVCIGGTDGQTSTGEAFLLQYRGGKVLTTPLPALPQAMDNGCAAYDPAGFIYVAGGQVDGKASTAAWRLR